MSGTKGRSGGPRPGAGRPPKPQEAPPPAPPSAGTPLAFLLAVMNDQQQDAKLRVRAAVAAAQYVHTRRADGGKKEEAADKAKTAATGRYAPKAPPKLKVVD